MSQLSAVKKPIAKELEQFELRFRDAMSSNVPLLDRITHYIVKRKGKQVRPMFVLLCARLFGPITDEVYVGASMIELLHTTSLVHDDVVDDSHLRRGFFSVNALWKNKIAVLVGDYLLSKGLLLAVEHNQFGVLKIVSEAVKQLTEGELLQLEKARGMSVTEDIYYKIIEQKTASLMAAACSTGGATAGATDDEVERLRQFGVEAGIAFQIKDDLFDYGYKNVGKPTGIDIKEKKLTLPLLHALDQVSKGERKRITTLIKRKGDTRKGQKEVIAFVNEQGGIQYAEKVMLEYRDRALVILDSFPDGEAKTALRQLVQYVVDRQS